jgi:hypothetical protein
MRQIVPDLLWIGNAIDARDVAAVLQTGIETVIDVAIEEKPVVFPRDIVYCRIPLNDGQGNSLGLLRTVVELTTQMMLAKRRTIGCCGAGMSRSPAIAAMAIARVRQEPPEKTLLEIVCHAPHDVSPLLWADLCKAFTEE